jgi:hypothetical protein
MKPCEVCGSDHWAISVQCFVCEHKVKPPTQAQIMMARLHIQLHAAGDEEITEGMWAIAGLPLEVHT